MYGPRGRKHIICPLLVTVKAKTQSFPIETREQIIDSSAVDLLLTLTPRLTTYQLNECHNIQQARLQLKCIHTDQINIMQIMLIIT